MNFNPAAADFAIFEVTGAPFLARIVREKWGFHACSVLLRLKWKSSRIAAYDF